MTSPSRASLRFAVGTKMKENHRGCSQAEDVSQQHAVPSFAVEGGQGPDRYLRQPRLP